MAIKQKTKGERLFLLLRDELLVTIGNGHQNWSNFQSLLNQVSGNEEFGNYLRGATAIQLMRRLLRHWKDERPQIAQEPQFVGSVVKHIREEGLPGLSDADTSKLARAVIEAEQSSRQTINLSTRRAIVNGKILIPCYLCSSMLSPSAPQDSNDHLTLEHLWPQSIGGDSIEDNLLPACKKCQIITKDTISWEWLNIHNMVLPAEPSSQALEALSKNKKFCFAKHYHEAFNFANTNNISLKEALLRIGPMKTQMAAGFTGNPVTFFDLVPAD
jgi:hypothetical protein